MRRALLIAIDRFADERLSPLGSPFADAKALSEVLADPDLGGFDQVDIVHNQSSSVVGERIEQFFTVDCQRSDTALLYLSGHGVLDQQNRLCFATSNTDSERLLTTSVPATLIHQILDNGPQRQIIVLDCCYAGAFASGMRAKGDQVGLGAQLGAIEETGRGRVILTATDRLQYALEEAGAETGSTSLYTGVLVDGIRTGRADLDGDGLIDPDELHDYAVARLRGQGRAQRPHRWAIGTHGELFVAKAGGELPIGDEISPLPSPADSRTTGLVGTRTMALAALLILVLSIGGVAAWVWGGAGDTVDSVTEQAADRPAEGTYSVSVAGSAIDGEAFERQGELRIHHGDGDRFDVCLKVGNPFAPSAVGAIFFGTAGDCFGSGPDSPVATITTNETSFEVSPLAQMLDEAGNANAFSFTTALTGCWFTPDDGLMRIEPEGSRLTGGINLRGLDGCGSGASGTYTAVYSATLVSSDPDAIISTPTGGDKPLDDPSTAQVIDGVRYVVSRVIDFETVEGNGAFLDRARARVEGAVFVIGESEFSYEPPDARTDLFPITGSVTRAGDVLVLSAMAESSDGLDASATVGGSLDLTGSEPLLQLSLSTTAGSNTTAYEGTVVLEAR